MKYRSCLLIWLFSVAAFLAQPGSSCFGDGISIFSPGIANNSSSDEPFLVGPTQRTLRFQQVYGASDFDQIASGGGWISGFEVNLVGGGPCCDFVLPNTEIRLSVTRKQPDGLSPVFLDNVGVNESVVFGAGPLRIAALTGTGFDILIPFSTPYFYDPSMGNLLLEVRNYVGPSYPVAPNRAGLLAFEDTLGDSVSRVSVRDVNATSGDLSTAGLVTLFHITPVSEPSTLALLALGLGVCAWRWRNKKQGTAQR